MKKYQVYRTKHGFTLIELLIVIVIIGILVTMGIFAFQSSQKKSRDSKRKSDLNQISKALEMYNNDRGVYPNDSSGRIAGCESTFTLPCEWGNIFGNGSTVTYMVKLPKDPTSTWQYTYKPATKGYYLYARLENAQDVSIPADGKVYNVMCGDYNCNYVLTSVNTSEPATISQP
jgi:general secretion pathway protein G